MLTTYLHLAPRLRMSGAVPLLPYYAFTAWTGTCSGVLNQITLSERYIRGEINANFSKLGSWHSF
jgi:hypothetical protein